MNKTSISILTKAPEPGKVKTRFNLSNEETIKIYSEFLEEIYSTVNSTKFEALWFIDGDPSCLKLDIKAGALYIQKGDSLSDRIKHAFDISKHLGFENTIVIGGDSPEISELDFSDTAKILETKETQVVLGPTFDGGIYLLGQGLEASDKYLNDMIWSTKSVYDDLICNLDKEAISHVSKEFKHDIDTKEDYLKYLQRTSD
jgi:uncharacterized protein